MGWGRMLLLGDVGQQLDIQEVRDHLNRAIDEINKGEQIDADQDLRIQRLEKENQELKVCVWAMARLLVKKKVINATELSSIVSAIDEP